MKLIGMHCFILAEVLISTVDNRKIVCPLDHSPLDSFTWWNKRIWYLFWNRTQKTYYITCSFTLLL